MNSKHKHLVIFKDLLETEKKARDLCEKYYKELTDTFLAEKAKEMLFDEEKHVKIAEDLIAMASRYSLRSVDELMKGDHLCCFYESDEEFKKIMIPFIKQGLMQGEKVIYIVDANTKETIVNYLLEDKVDANQYLSKGQLQILPVDQAYMKDGIFDPDKMIELLESETQKAVQEGFSALRVTGEMTWALRGLPGSERLIEYESKLNKFFPGSRALAICQYDMRMFKPDILMDALATHPLAIIKGELLDNPNFIPPSEFLSKEKAQSVLSNSLANLFALKEFKIDLENLNRASINLLEDLTESKTKLEKYSKDLETALKVKSDFTATVSHELRTPLAAIKEGIGVVIDGVAGEPNKEQKEFLEIAKRNVDRLSRLINNVLDFQKLEAGKMALKFKKYEINSILRDAFSSSENLAKKKGLGYNLNLLENPFEAELDHDRIMQVLVNLIDNAIKYTDQGSIKISASLSDDKVKISVKDTGHGIRAEDIPKLFEKYAQVERKPGGTGLGLAISKEIIEAHGGKIWVDSQFGAGSDFQFTLPVSQKSA